MLRMLIYTVVPILLSLFLILVTLKPELIIREEKRYMFTKYRAIWLTVALVFLVANSINLYFYLLRMQ